MPFATVFSAVHHMNRILPHFPRIPQFWICNDIQEQQKGVLTAVAAPSDLEAWLPDPFESKDESW